MNHPNKMATIIGGRGFIGQHLHHALMERGWECYLPARNADDLSTRRLGHVFYCAGLTADFRQRPFATVEAHVQHLAFVLEHAHFDSLTYLSSTRVYAGALETHESTSLKVNPGDSSDLYNLSKLMGESLCLNACSVRPDQRTPVIHVVRLSNVVGAAMPPNNFLAEVIHDAKTTGAVRFRTSPDSEKDYVSISDVVRYLPQIALAEKGGIINLASGKNLSNRELANCLQQAGIICSFEQGAPTIRFPAIDNQLLRTRFGDLKFDVLDMLPQMLND